LVVALAVHAPSLAGELARRGEVHLLGARLTGAVLYLGPWSAGWVLGGAAAILVGRVRGVPAIAMLGVDLIFTVGFAVGGRLQYRLEAYPVATALWMSPEDLLGPGGRTPLGLLAGGLLAIGWCRLRRSAPWRDAGDALAVHAAVAGAIGRVGCLFTGCCMGVACAWPFAGFCLRYPAPTPAFLNQVATAGLDPAAAYSYPAHVLPAYFALTSLALLGVLLLLWRRGAPAGAMLATFGIVEPMAKIGLEALRAVPRQGPWMIAIPLTTMAITLFVALVLRRRN
jgi:phosphatidylglycerol:prolipoprotein diacylglycerol transferase